MGFRLRLNRSLVVCLLAICGVLVGCDLQPWFDLGLAVTDKGVVQGNTTPSMKEFLGIPYAAPPVGELRWQPIASVPP